MALKSLKNATKDDESLLPNLRTLVIQCQYEKGRHEATLIAQNLALIISQKRVAKIFLHTGD